MQDVGRPRRKEPSKEHRVKNVKSNDPNYKIGNQRMISQSFASDLLQEEKKQAENKTLNKCSPKESKNS